MKKLIEPIKVKQFTTLDEFIDGSNNFYMYFQNGNVFGEARRENSVYERFSELYPLATQTLTAMVTRARQHPVCDLPHSMLYGAYKVMTNLIDKNDKYALNSKGVPNEWYLIS